MQKLNKIPDKNPFKVPENYFEEVNRKIISATTGYTSEVRKTGLYVRLRPFFAIAASVAGFVLLTYITVQLSAPDRTNSQLSEELSEENSELYMNDIDIISLEENATSLVLAKEGTDINKTDIIDYLLLENIEINDIYERL